MNLEALIINVFSFFVFAIIIEATVMAVFSISVINDISQNNVGKMVRDIIIIGISLAFCFFSNNPLFSLFNKTGIVFDPLLSKIISTLVLARLAMIIQKFFNKIKESGD